MAGQAGSGVATSEDIILDRPLVFRGYKVWQRRRRLRRDLRTPHTARYRHSLKEGLMAKMRCSPRRAGNPRLVTFTEPDLADRLGRLRPFRLFLQRQVTEFVVIRL